ncbi:phosphoethanolamine--lipid A transferase [Bacteriovorax sp. PP10]|uniref:Phosphoethanolamine--lipid A transferase n=1 Tax=Bacteriovorax antarcticus TaxID=3088717 RepID=A0ABU5VVC7_9BACT|nr:phosphoethanolamine--lipid A transferase [Bacteriovorax sp. PP10]MEA9355985.1 phosphoethanolamine--lipid A transferase [Bacteriovorax sp. PP10]
MKLKITQFKLTLLISILFTLFYNFTFFKKTLAIYPLTLHNAFFLASLVIILTTATNLIFTLLLLIMNSVLRLFKIKVIYKRFFLVIFFLAMAAAYVMDSYGVVIDDTMLLNIVRTDAKESLDLITYKLLFYTIFLLIMPTILIYKTKIEEQSFKEDVIIRLKTLSISLILVFVMLVANGKFYASFFREQKPLRYYTNPTYWIYSMGKFGSSLFKNPNKVLQALARESVISAHDLDRDLVILVVGETARRDRFSLNGHKNETNPLLKKEDAISFTNVTSCGTSTAISVPCMFSHFGRTKFSADEANSTENLLDVLSHTKDVSILWRDNNSDSKGVASRVQYEDYKSAATNSICDPECRDEGMLVGLQDYIDKTKEKDILIVLHQMGNHGPAYYKRYPKKFEIFTPVCQTSELEKCTNEEIGNAYDNAILYTDFFLSKVISLLKDNSVKFSTSMFYISDHGESLGENGIYLHGLPYMMAPDVQKEVAMIMWFGGKMAIETDYVSLKKILNAPYSHDNVFHTVLGMMEVESSAYKPELDILHGIHVQPRAEVKN